MPIHDNKGSKLLGSGMPREEPLHNPTSKELLVGKSIAKDSEHCATELDQSRIEKTHA